MHFWVIATFKAQGVAMQCYDFLDLELGQGDRIVAGVSSN